MDRRRRGFVLPTTILVMTLLTVMLTAAFTLVSAEFRATDNSLATQRALAIAQAGLQAYLSRTNALAGTYDSVASYPFSDGYASVAASRLVPSVGSQQAVWIVRSYGFATTGLLTGQVQARRVVAQLATYNPGIFPVQAALISGNGNEIRPWLDLISTNPNPISGVDGCAGGTDTVGLVFATGDYVSTSTPPGTSPGNGSRSLGSRSEVYDSTHIDWPSLLAGNFTPDYDVTSGTFPPLPGGWPTYYANGNLTLNAINRPGVLVVRGNLTLNAGANWRGAVIVGGRIITNPFGIYNIKGATITGLNNQIVPGSVGPNILYRTLGSGSGYGLKWDSCHLVSTRAAMSSLAPIRNAWVDQWSLY